MGRMRVKICGVTSPDDARMLAAAGVDAVGVIFAESPRQVTAAQAKAIVDALPPWVSPVGVFVNETAETIARIAREVGLTTIQLHGEELPCTVKDVAGHFKVVKAFRVASQTDLADALDYVAQCQPDACLIDSRVAGAYGGTGHTAPWDLVAAAGSALQPLILGGGLTPENVAEAIRIVQPWGVETSSGVESAPGKKDKQRVLDFVRNATSIDLSKD
ncbi:MAG: phosphoribosylanthranilate isomerase [Planctomycetes bacterium]|nr:phosphoribosylanthranilate isomerase [Planctomycetota bacterium]